MSTPTPGPSSGGNGAAAGTNGAQAGASSAAAGANSTTATPGAFARRFPRLHTTFTRYASTRAGKLASTAWTRRRPLALGLFATYGAVSYAIYQFEAYQRTYIHPDSWLVLKVYPGAIVEAKGTPSITALLNAPSAGEDAPRVMELFELVRAINLAANDKRVKGIFADFSSIHIPSSVTPEPLGLAQIEEIITAIHTFRTMKQQQYILEQTAEKLNEKADLIEGDDSKIEMAKTAIGLVQGQKPGDRDGKDADAMSQSDDAKQIGKPTISNDGTPSPETEKLALEAVEELQRDLKDVKIPATTIAWADSFDSQGSYMLASAFEEVYVQPSGSVPLMGLRFQLPFFKRALDWLGIKVYAEARREYKAIISQFTQEDGLTDAQLDDEGALLGELARSVAYTVGVNRFPDTDPNEAANKVMELSRTGPFSASEAAEKGLISGVKYKREVVKMLGEEPKVRTLKSYSSIMDKMLNRSLKGDQIPKVAVVYLRGTISNAPGEFSASTVIKGLKEAADDDEVTSIVLRIDSGGGDATTSDTLWDAITRVREETGKPVIASFGNISASGGYFAAAAADAILAGESTITGSIGVASLRPTFTKPFFERLGLRVQTLFTGSNVTSEVHELSDDEKSKSSRHVDELYSQFLGKVCEGRSISSDVIEELAGGRVWTGYKAYLHCKPEESSDEQESTESKEEAPADEGKDEKRKVQPSAGNDVLMPLPAAKMPKPDVILQWNFDDVTREGEMSTVRISADATNFSKQSVQKDSKNEKGEDDEASVTQAIAEMVSSEEKEAVPSKAQKRPRSQEDEDSQLAVAAHTAASKSQAKDADDGVAAQDKEEEEQLGPYGRGLVDGLGGLLDAGTLALNMGVQRELDALIKEGMTPEQAMMAIRPGAPRQVDEDGTTQLVMDLRLTRYPREKGFLERVRELNRRGDEPTLSAFFPNFVNLGAEIKAWLGEAAVQMLVRSWSDPAFVQRVVGALDREQMRQQAPRMERSYNVQY